MHLWLPRRCENAEWIAVEAETLIRDLDVSPKGAWFSRSSHRSDGVGLVTAH